MKWVIKPIVFLSCLSPLTVLCWRAYFDDLSANPISDITNTTGTWTLRFLMITLAITPLRKITRWNILIQLRRMLGLFAFFYVCLHFLTYIWLDQFFQFEDILKDVARRPFITVGFTAFLLLIPLALTSTKKMIRRLGGRRLNTLHKLIYVAGICGVIHYLWLVKADTQRPSIYAGILVLLLGYRLIDLVRTKSLKTSVAPITAEDDIGGAARAEGYDV